MYTIYRYLAQIIDNSHNCGYVGPTFTVSEHANITDLWLSGMPGLREVVGGEDCALNANSPGMEQLYIWDPQKAHFRVG